VPAKIRNDIDATPAPHPRHLDLPAVAESSTVFCSTIPPKGVRRSVGKKRSQPAEPCRTRACRARPGRRSSQGRDVAPWRRRVIRVVVRNRSTGWAADRTRLWRLVDCRHPPRRGRVHAARRRSRSAGARPARPSGRSYGGVAKRVVTSNAVLRTRPPILTSGIFQTRSLDVRQRTRRTTSMIHGLPSLVCGTRPALWASSRAARFDVRPV
jgi:hypothetical protein